MCRGSLRSIATDDGEYVEECVVYPAKHFVMSEQKLDVARESIRQELEERIQQLADSDTSDSGVDAVVVSERLRQRVERDLELLDESGWCSGMENYSRHFTGRQPGDPPCTLVDYMANER